MSTDARWSDETREMVARAIHHPQSGSWGRDLQDWDRDYFRDRADVVLAVLVEEGLLLPPGGETEIQYRYKDRDGFTVIGITPEQASDEGWRLLDTRAVTRWPDDRWHFGPWQLTDVSGEDR